MKMNNKRKRSAAGCLASLAAVAAVAAALGLRPAAASSPQAAVLVAVFAAALVCFSLCCRVWLGLSGPPQP